jgi:hypothetical protein
VSRGLSVNRHKGEDQQLLRPTIETGAQERCHAQL